MVTRTKAPRGGIDALEIAFDDGCLVADAGLVLPATLCRRLGAQQVIDGLVERPGDPTIGARAGAKALSVVFAMLAGADSIDDTERLRAGATGSLLGFRPRAASTAGKWLRGLGFGPGAPARCSRRRAACPRLGRGRPAEAPGDRPRLIDRPGPRAQEGRRPLRLHPGARLSPALCHLGYHRGRDPRPPSPRGRQHPVRGQALLRGVDRALSARGPYGRLSRARRLGIRELRPVSGDRPHGGHFSVAATMQAHVRTAIASILEADWAPIAYPGSGRAEIAETTIAVDPKHRTGAHPLPARLRLVVRRVLNHDPHHPQQPLFADYRYFPILTSRADDLALVEAEHRDHAQIELVIRDLKDAGLAHIPSGKTYANMAWLVLASLAHNLQRWTVILGLGERRITQHRTIRNRYLAIPGRLATHAGRWRLRLPAGWPWRERFLAAIERLRALPTLT